ncbi:MAG: hypothetical protein ACYDAG_03355 [Chloroflexota bacterium]
MPNKLLSGLALALAIATAGWLGYSIGQTRSIRDIAQLQRDVDTDRYTLLRAGTMVHFERLGGGGKPYIRTSDGLELLDFSDWDQNSRIIVDGTGYSLVKLYPRSSVDYGRFRVAEALYGNGWFLEREITLDKQGVVHIRHTFVARRPIAHVELAVAQVHQYFISVQLKNGGVVATESRLTRGTVATGKDEPIAYKLFVTPEGPGPAPRGRVGELGMVGVASFIAESNIDHPAVDQQTSLGGEAIRVEAAR